jgi:hypothetical protein
MSFPGNFTRSWIAEKVSGNPLLEGSLLSFQKCEVLARTLSGCRVEKAEGLILK